MGNPGTPDMWAEPTARRRGSRQMNKLVDSGGNRKFREQKRIPLSILGQKAQGYIAFIKNRQLQESSYQT